MTVGRVRPIRRLVAAGLVVGLAAGPGCGGDDVCGWAGSGSTGSGRPTESPGWRVMDGAAALEPLDIEEEPLWRSESAGPFRYLGGASSRHDDLVLWGGDERSSPDEHLGVLDAATGEVRWAVTASRELPGGDGARLRSDFSPRTPLVIGFLGHDDWAVLVGYELRREAATEYGLAALSGEDGHVVWKSPIVTDSSAGTDGEIVQAVQAGDGFAVAVTGVPGERFAGRGPYGNPRLVAVDTADGARLWERPDLDLAGVASHDVLAYESAPASTAQPPARSFVILDPDTGDEGGSPGDGEQPAIAVLAGGESAVLEAPAQDGSRTMAVVDVDEPGAGDLIFGNTLSTDGCAASGLLIACRVRRSWSGEDAALATLRVDNGEARVSEAPLPEPTVEAVVGGRILLSRGHQRPWVSVDRCANTIDTDLPGRYLPTQGPYAVFVSEPGGPYTVHSITD